MSDKDGWLEQFGASHADLRFPAVYWPAFPAIVLGFVGILWTLPTPEQFYTISPLLNWGSAFLMVTAVYYFIISLPIAIGMLPFLLGVAAIQLWLANTGWPVMQVAAGLLVLGCIGLWAGHSHRRSIRPIVSDLMLTMIAPAFMLSVLYRRFGIPY